MSARHVSDHLPRPQWSPLPEERVTSPSCPAHVPSAQPQWSPLPEERVTPEGGPMTGEPPPPQWSPLPEERVTYGDALRCTD